MSSGFVRSRSETSNREEEIAALAVYLASPISDYVTGQDIIIDGGLGLVNP